MSRISIKPVPSKILIGVFTFLFCGALISLLLLKLSLPITLPLAFIIFCSYWLVLKHHVLLHGRMSIVDFWHKEADIWYLRTKLGTVVTATLARDSVVARYLLVLNFKVTGKLRRLSVLLCPDSVGPDKLRALRVCLLTTKRR